MKLTPLHRHVLCLSLAAFAAASISPALASGSYCICLPKPPARTAKVDRDKYDLGQKVYNERTTPATGDAAAQKPRLEKLQSQLPARTAKKKDLVKLAGKLTPEQLDALEYYVGQRYPHSH